MPPHLSTILEIQYCQNQPKFNGVSSKHNLSKIKDETYIINLDEYESLETHWIVLYLNDVNETCFDCFGVKHIPKSLKIH